MLGPYRPLPARFAIAAGVILTLAGGACGVDDRSGVASASSTASSATTTTHGASATTKPLAAVPVTAMPAGPAAVEIVDFAFTPTPVVVRPGGTVTWTNEDDAAHSISDTSPLRTATSKPLSKGEQFSITYSKAGTYPYVCGIHNYMQGSVEVKN
jgi:plastocyanin